MIKHHNYIVLFWRDKLIWLDKRRTQEVWKLVEGKTKRQTIRGFIKVVGYTNNAQKSVALPHINNTQLESMMEEKKNRIYVSNKR